MPRSTATVPTMHASRYLQQLCKHWGHRFLVDFSPEKGAIDFGGGQSAALSATDTALTITVYDTTEQGLEELERVVADHLGRFAFREPLLFDWLRQP